MADNRRHNKKQWKKLQRRSSGGGDIYIGKKQLELLAMEGDLDLDEEIRYSVSVGVSDGRSRAFIGIKNAESDDDSGE